MNGKGSIDKSDVMHPANVVAAALVWKEDKIQLGVGKDGKMTVSTGVAKVTYDKKNLEAITSAVITDILNLRDKSSLSFADGTQIKRLQNFYIKDVEVIMHTLAGDLPPEEAEQNYTHAVSHIINRLANLSTDFALESDEQLDKVHSKATEILDGPNQSFNIEDYRFIQSYKSALIDNADRLTKPKHPNKLTPNDLVIGQGITEISARDVYLNKLLNTLGRWLRDQDSLRDNEVEEEPRPKRQSGANMIPEHGGFIPELKLKPMTLSTESLN